MFVVVFAAACGNNEKKDDEEALQILEVKLEVAEQADAGDAVPFKALVTFGDEKVSDANDVQYEVWEEGNKDNSEMIEAKNEGDGVYTAEKVFEHDGVYVVQVHVTARDQHNMPKTAITIGEGASHDGGHDHGDHEHGADGFSMHFMEPKDPKAGEDTELMVHLQNGDAPLEKAQVRFEIWSNNQEDKREWVNATESKPGEYIANHPFSEAETYQLQIHVENDDGLHEHETHEIEVK